MDGLESLNYGKPKYPMKRDALKNPDLLLSLPERWKRNAAAGTAAGLTVAMLLAGCAAKPEPGGTAGPQGAAASPAQSLQATLEPSTAAQTPSACPPAVKTPLAAALFRHGEGRGGFGCDSVVPPVYFSEEEAADIIGQVAREYGVSFEQNTRKVNVIQPETTTLPGTEPKGKTAGNGAKAELVLDGYNAETGMGYEFVSVGDVEAWAVNETNATYESIDALDAADQLKAQFDREKIPAAVFYEPFADIDKTYEEHKKEFKKAIDYKALEAELREKSTEALKQQVKDFMEWLKGQGIL
jgi:hypothetical protein